VTTPRTEPIAIPRLCEPCRRHLLIGSLRLGPEDPWAAAEALAQLLMLQRIVRDRAVQRATERDAARLEPYLAERGCPGCAWPLLLEDAIGVLLRGVSHAAAVLQFTARDPYHPVRRPRPRPA
jgi:hypothetical protein